MLLCSGTEAVRLLLLLYEEENGNNSENPEEAHDRISHMLCTGTVCSLFPEPENRIAMLGAELDTLHWVRVKCIHAVHELPGPCLMLVGASPMEAAQPHPEVGDLQRLASGTVQV